MRFILLFCMLLTFPATAGLFSPVDEQEEPKQEKEVVKPSPAPPQPEVKTQSTPEPEASEVQEVETQSTPEPEASEVQVLDEAELDSNSFPGYAKVEPYLPKELDSTLKKVIYVQLYEANEILLQTAGRGPKALEEASSVLKNLNVSCKENDCSKGLDYKKFDLTTLQSVIFFNNHTGAFSAFELEDTGERIVLFRGSDLVAKGLLSEEYYQALFGAVKEADRLYVNLSSDWANYPLFVALAKLIKDGGKSIHIYGNCSNLCANFLVPASPEVRIEPTGTLMYQTSFNVLNNLFSKAIEEDENTEKEYFNRDYDNDPSLLFAKVSQVAATKDGRNLALEILATSKEGQNILNQMNAYLSNNEIQGLNSIEEWQGFFQSLDEADIKKVKEIYLALVLSKSPRKSLKTRFEALNEVEKIFFENFKIETENDYSFQDLLALSQNLSLSPDWRNFSSKTRDYFRIEEVSNPIFAIAPTVDLLKSLGIKVVGQNKNFQGVNSVLRLGSLNEKATKLRVISIDEDAIEECDFFSEGASYTKDSLEQCLDITL